MTYVIEEAAQRMVETVETTPSGLRPGKPDRVWTGHMRDEIRAEPVTSGGGVVKGVWGWPDAEAYFNYQETGEATGLKSIPPMHALLSSFIWAREELQTQIDFLSEVK
jgi:hypothetical protein